MEKVSSSMVYNCMLREKSRQIAALQAEIAELKGMISEAQRKQDAEDAEVFRFLREKPSESEGCLRIIIEV